jgi:tRNA_anti-like
MTGKKKKIAAALLFCAITAAVVVYYLWNKPHLDVVYAQSVKTGAADLYNSFITDSAAAKKKFSEQVIEVTGIISGVSKNQQNQTVILLKSGVEGANINCTMEGEAGKTAVGENVSVKGICEGLGQGDADLGILGDLYLVRCYIAE